MPQAKPYPLIFLGSLELAAHCLRALASSPLYQIKAVITRERPSESARKAAVLAAAAELRLPQQSFKGLMRDFSAGLFQSRFLIAVAVSYGQILPPDFLKIFPQRAFNIHPSLLPLYRGAAPIERALMAGERQSGVSLQLISQKLDAGDLIGQRKFPILNGDTAGEVFEKAKEAALPLLLKDLPLFLKGEKKAKPQGKVSGALYAAKIQKEECRIQWLWPADKIHNHIRALSPHRGAWANLRERRLKIYRSETLPAGAAESGGADEKPAPGTILKSDKGVLAAACGKGALSLREVQLEGKKKLCVKEFLKGASLRPGDRLL